MHTGMEWCVKGMAVVAAVLLAGQLSCGKPVDRRRPTHPPTPAPAETEDRSEGENRDTGLEYNRYLQQVVEALESDDEFRKRLETANVSDVQSGAIATHLELVNRAVRTKLDELKRMEIMRLQQLARLKSRAIGGRRVNRMEIPGHLDLRNPHSFEVKDLQNLILKTARDLEEVDERRRKDFKEYEMEKEYRHRQEMKTLPEEQRQGVQERREKLRRKHREHEKIQHPGSKDQFEEVWEKEDKMEDQDFDPRTFFMMHDLNEDMFWDIQEVEAVLQRELGKAYDSKNSPDEDDPKEREEEMSRMREHVFQEVDQDKDLMISMEEFMQYTGRRGDNQKFEENEGWETVDEKPAFSDDEYQEYIRQHHAQPGEVPPPVDSNNLHFQPEGPIRVEQQEQQQQQQQEQQQQQQQEQQQQQQQEQLSPEQKGQQEMPQAALQGEGGAQEAGGPPVEGRQDTAAQQEMPPAAPQGEGGAQEVHQPPQQVEGEKEGEDHAPQQDNQPPASQ